MKKMCTLLLSFCYILSAFSQADIYSAKRLEAKDSIKVNGKWIKGVSNDTTNSHADSNKLITEAAAKKYTDAKVAANTPSLTQSLTAQLGSGGTVGGVSTGQSFAAGTNIENVVRSILIKVIHPTYTAPTAYVSSSPSGGTYEYGYNLGTITLSPSFTQNNGGSQTGVTYQKYISNWSNLSGNTDAAGTLTGSVSYRIYYTYNTGTCLTNNVGDVDCVGQIAAGTVYSNTITFTGTPLYYIGTSATATPTDAELRAAAQQSWAYSKGKSNINISVSDTKYVFYAYPSAQGTLTRIYNSIGDFSLDGAGWLLSTRSGFTNAQSATVPLNIYVLQAAQTGDVNGLTFQ